MTLEEYALNFHTGKIRFKDIPEEVQNDINFVRYMRKNKFSKTLNKGYDVIRDVFFANEEYCIKYSDNYKEFVKREHCFSSFVEMYNFVEGKKIYQDACYYQCTEERLRLDDFSLTIRQKIKLNKLLIDCSKTSFVKESINDVVKDLMPKTTSDIHLKCQELCDWADILYSKINAYDEFVKIYNEFQHQYMFDEDIILFVLTSIMRRDKTTDFLKLYYRCKSEGLCFVRGFFDYALWSQYEHGDIIKYYKYRDVYSADTQQKHKKEMELFLQNTKGKKPEIIKKYFEEKIGHYVIKYKFAELSAGFKYEYFDNFNDFVLACNNDLSDADLSNASDLSIDLSHYAINSHTLLPQKLENLTLTIEKEFIERYDDDNFVVSIYLFGSQDNIIKSRKFKFKYFFDFLAFLGKDLSNANLVLCNGLINLSNTDEINFENALVQSSCAKKFHLPCVPNPYQSFKYTNKEAEENESQTLSVFQQTRNELANGDANELMFHQSTSLSSSKAYYISDIHLLHRASNQKCESYDDVIHSLIKIAQHICPIDTENLIITGDVASDFDLYKTFVGILKKYCNARNIFFTLGNHELWNFADYQIDEIVQQYKNMLNQYDMHLLHNNIFVYGENYKWSEITQDDVLKYSQEELDKIIEHPRLVLFGGIGFSGFNENFNANHAIYANVINRDQEINETNQFNAIYKKVLPILKQHNSIVATHMPKLDWSGDQDHSSGVVYISGHTHRNFFYDDNETRIYADNQVGYNSDIVIAKYFYIDVDYDWFSKYPDGIHEITREDYNNFYRGKNIRMTCTREINVLYMLKRNGYYCFIHKNKSGKLSIFSGGAIKRLERKDIDYYYNNMQLMIDAINEPLTQYSNVQNNISRIIKQLGGSGKVHGCIIDIDFFNHIYVNPSNGAVRAYCAEDMVRKLIYPSVPQLLEAQCPEFHKTYLKLLESGNQNISQTLQPKNNLQPVLYLDTDIYVASRIIKKMQRIESQILTYWDDNALENYKTKIVNQKLLQKNENCVMIE